MASESEIRIDYQSARMGGPGLSIVISKPVLSTETTCWTCEIRLESETVRTRTISGASSLQALGLATGIIPALIQSLFPGETFTECGMPVILPADASPKA